MIVEIAKVISCNNGIAVVECKRKSSCGSCGQNDCGTKSLSMLTGEQHPIILKIRVDCVLDIGSEIKIGILEKSLIQAVSLIYGIPLLVMLLVAMIGSLLVTNDLLLAIITIVSTVLSFAILKIFLKKYQINTELKFLGLVN